MNNSKEKRCREDRRDQEIGPPEGWRDRRRSVERRMPEVCEVPFSEWLAQFRGQKEKSSVAV
jgi:hypothetical protein